MVMVVRRRFIILEIQSTGIQYTHSKNQSGKMANSSMTLCISLLTSLVKVQS